MRFSICSTSISPSIRDEDVLEARADVLDLEHLLLLGELERHVRGDGVGEPARAARCRRARSGSPAAPCGSASRTARTARRPSAPARPSRARRTARRRPAARHVGREVVARVEVARPMARSTPSTSTLTVPSGSFSSCRMVATVPTVVQVRGLRVVDVGLLLRDQQDLLVDAAWPARARGSTSRGRRTAGSPCAGRRRRRAAAAPATRVGLGATTRGLGLRSPLRALADASGDGQTPPVI